MGLPRFYILLFKSKTEIEKSIFIAFFLLMFVLCFVFVLQDKSLRCIVELYMFGHLSKSQKHLSVDTFMSNSQILFGVLAFSECR